MVRRMASFRVKGGKQPRAMLFAKEIAEFATEYEGVSSVEVYLDGFGNTGTIRWFVEYASLAALEKVQEQILSDKGYWEKFDQGADLLIEGSGQTVVMRKI